MGKGMGFLISDIAKQKAQIIEKRLQELQKQERQKETERAADCVFAMRYKICPYCGDKLARKGLWFKFFDIFTESDLYCDHCKKNFETWRTTNYY
jgi:hypothetical protein